MLALAAVLEPETLVVAPDPGIVALRVDPDERTPGRSGRGIHPFDDPLAEPPARECAPHGELVEVDGVGRPLAPEEGVVPQQRERRRRLVVDLDDVELALQDPLRELLLRK